MGGLGGIIITGCGAFAMATTGLFMAIGWELTGRGMDGGGGGCLGSIGLGGGGGGPPMPDLEVIAGPIFSFSASGLKYKPQFSF